MAFSMNTLIRYEEREGGGARLNSKEIPPTEGTGQTSIGWS